MVDPPAPQQSKRPWPQTLVILLLLGEILMFLGLAYLSLSSSIPFIDDVEIEEVLQSDDELVNNDELTLLSKLTTGLGMLVLVVFALFGAVTTIGQGKRAWRNVILAQGVTLLIAIQIYFGPPVKLFSYPLMMYGIIMVTYLMLPAVQAAFLPLGGDA